MLLHDVRIGFRLIRRAPLLHLAVVLILAVGIGLNSVVFSFFNGLLFRPNVTHDPTSFVRIYAERSGTSRPDALGVPTMMTLEEWEALRTGSKTLTAVTASKWATFPISDGVAANLRGLFVSCDFLRVHAPQTLVGRTFEESDCAAPGSAPLAILSERAWNSFFNRDPAIVGRSLIVNNHRITIIGVVADYAVGDPEVRMMFVPHTMYAALQGPADVFRTGPDRYAWLNLSGRLAAGHTAADAQRELRAILGRLEQLHPGRSTQARVTNGALIDEPGRARTIVALVIAAAMLVLLLVCANVATLLLSRAEARRREMGIRTALGASHRRLLTQLSIEGALPALAAAGLSLALAFLLPGRLAQLLAGFPVGISLAPDLRVLAYTLLIALVAGIVAALWSVLPSVRLGAWGGVEVQSRIDWQVRPPTRRDNLIAQQLAASLALLVAIGLVWRAQHVLANPDLPYDAERILVASFDLTRLGYSPARAAGLYSEVLTRLDNLPTVRTMAASTHPPFRGVLPSQISIETDDRRALPVSVRAVSPDYFALLGIRTIDGRLFSEEEAQSGPDPLPVVVSEALMRGISGDTQLLRGRRVTLPHGASAVIVGVVADTSTVRVSDLDGPVLYQPMSAAGRWSRAPTESRLSILLGLSSDPRPLAEAIQRHVRTLDPALVVTTETVAASIDREAERYSTVVMFTAALAGLAFVLSLVGLYGVTAFLVAQRRTEIGIRMALGASSDDIVRLFLWSLRRPVAMGVGAGAVLAALGVWWLRYAGFLPSSSGNNPWIYSAALVWLACTAAVATAVPTLRATRVSPSILLRTE